MGGQRKKQTFTFTTQVVCVDRRIAAKVRDESAASLECYRDSNRNVLSITTSDITGPDHKPEPFTFRPDYNHNEEGRPNRERAADGEKAMLAYNRNCKLDGEDSFRDMVVDTLHYCDREAIPNPEELIRLALNDWKQER